MTRKLSWALALVVGVIAFTLVLLPRPATSQPALAGTILHHQPAPDFRLRDQFGKPISLSRLRGKTVIMTFLQAHCKQTCPRVAEKIHRVIRGLGVAQKGVAILAISTDPQGDTMQATGEFSRQHGMLHLWHYLGGTRKDLLPVWRAYYIYAAPRASPAGDQAHTSATYLIDGQGRERVLMGGDPDAVWLDRDVRILAGVRVSLNADKPPPAAMPGSHAPGFGLTTLNKSSLSLRSLRGKVVLLNFWASWCKPCRSEMPVLSAWQRQIHDSHFTLVGIAQQEDRATAEKFVRKLRITYPIALDEGGDVSARYNVLGLPTSVLIDQQGIVRSVKTGVVSRRYLRWHIQPFLERRGGQ